MKEEIWKDITGYEGLYQISTLGNVKSLGNGKSLNSLNHVEKIMKPLNRNGYLFVKLCKDGKPKCFNIHRLVAEAFLSNPDNLPCVNHKDENKHNNNLDNLEFCSYQYNTTYGTAIERRAEKKRHPVKCLDLETNETYYFNSIIEADRKLNIRFQTIQYYCTKSKYPYKNRYKFELIEKEKD